MGVNWDKLGKDGDELQFQIAKERDEARKLARKSQMTIDELDKARTDCWKEMEKTTAELEKKLEETKKPFLHNIKLIEQQIEKEKKIQWSHNLRERTASADVKAKFSQKLSEFIDGEAFKGYMRKHGINLRAVVKIEKKLPNGVTLYRHADNEETRNVLGVAYFAVKGKIVIGFCLTRKAEHIGDYADRWMWINEPVLKYKNQCVHDIHSFKDWKGTVGAVRKFVPIDLDNKNNKKILEQEWRITSLDFVEGE